MNATEDQETALERVLIDLAHSRGLVCLDELRDQLIAAGHDRTAKHLGGYPAVGFGRDLHDVLCLSEEERERLGRAFAKTFLSGR
jgi:hypothetical protein